MTKNMICQCCLKNEFEFKINQTKWFCSDSCRSQFSKAINSLLSPNDETSHIIRARMNRFLNEHEFDVAEGLFLRQALEKLDETLYLRQKPIRAFELVIEFAQLYKEEIRELTDARRDKISIALKARGLYDAYLWR